MPATACRSLVVPIRTLALRRDAAPGVDGQTWAHYGEGLEEHLQDLSERLKRGAYRAKPVRRVYIAKDSGGQRPLGVTALEDKLVQRAAVEVLNAIYETDFLGFSYYSALGVRGDGSFGPWPADGQPGPQGYVRWAEGFAYVRANDIYVERLADGAIVPLT